MKKPLLFVLLSASVLIPTVRLQANGNEKENFVLNGGFELDSNDDGKTDFWFVHPGNKKVVEGAEFVWIHGDAAEGRSFIRAKKTGGAQVYQISSVLSESHLADIGEIRDYLLVLKGRIRGAELMDTPAIALQVFARKKGETATRFVNHVVAKPKTIPDGAWTEVKTTFRLGDVLLPDDELARLELVLWVPSNTGHTDFDDISLATSR